MSLNSFSIDNDNPVPRLSELRLRIEPLTEGEKLGINPSLRIGSIEILPSDDDRHSFAFSATLKRVEFQLLIEGGEVDDEGRLGEKLCQYVRGLSEKITIEEDTTSQSKRGVEASLEAATSIFNPSGSAKLEAAQFKQRSEKNTTEVNHNAPVTNVIARGGNIWEIDDKLENILDGKYLEGERICIVSLSEKSNRTEIRGVVCCNMRDLVLKPLDKTNSLFHGATRQKMIKILVGRRLKELNKGIYREKKPYKDHDRIILSFSLSKDVT